MFLGMIISLIINYLNMKFFKEEVNLINLYVLTIFSWLGVFMGILSAFLEIVNRR
jgi:hypothetical protein